MSLPVIIIGGGGHAKVLIDALKLNGVMILGIVDADLTKKETMLSGVPVIGDDREVERHRPDTVLLANGIGSVERPVKRSEVFDAFTAKGYSFATVYHPSAIIAADVQVGQGAQIMAGAVVQPGCIIGADVIVNTRAAIDHDCRIGNHVHVAPGVVLSGNVTIGTGTHIGAGTTIIQGISIGAQVMVGAGSLVTKDLREGVTAYGVPAKVVTQ